MRFAIITNGAVANVAEADEEFGLSQGWVVAGTAQIGDLWDGTIFSSVQPTETPEEIIKRLEDSVQRHLDQTAQQRGYDHMLSLSTYASSTHAKFAAEGQAGVEWRDNVWQACLDIMADVQEGNRPVPTRKS